MLQGTLLASTESRGAPMGMFLRGNVGRMGEELNSFIMKWMAIHGYTHHCDGDTRLYTPL